MKTRTVVETESPSLSRREFLAAAAVSAASTVPLAAAGAAGRPPAVQPPNGRIDCQSHLFCPDVVALMEKRTSDPRVFTRDGVRVVQMGDWLRKIPPHYMDVSAKLAAMDANGIAMTALSVNDPGPEWFGAEGPAVARMLNDFVAGIARAHPTRFFGLCVLPLQDVRASIAELDRCVRKLGMKGILLYT